MIYIARTALIKIVILEGLLLNILTYLVLVYSTSSNNFSSEGLDLNLFWDRGACSGTSQYKNTQFLKDVL